MDEIRFSKEIIARVASTEAAEHRACHRAEKGLLYVDLFLKTADSKSFGAIPIQVTADIFLGLWTLYKLLH